MTDNAYRVLGRYRRTVSSIPASKRLVSVTCETDAPRPFGVKLGDLCPDVLFSELEGLQGSRYWGKKWSGERVHLEAPTIAVERFLSGLRRDDFCLAREYSPSFGMIYVFDERLFASSRVVHYWNRHEHFTREECAQIENTGDLIIKATGLPELPLKELTDFQTVRVPSGLIYLDFEVWPGVSFSP